MTDPVLAFLLIAGFLAAASAVRFFRSLEHDFLRTWRTALVAGAIAGVLIALAGDRLHAIATGLVLTIAALYVRLTGDEIDAIDGMLSGACMGAAAAVPLIVVRATPLRDLSECLLAGAVAGFGITWAAFHVADRLRQTIIDVVTAAVATAAVVVPEFIRLEDRSIATGVASLIPLIVILAVFAQWSSLRRELEDERDLGFIDPEDVRPTAHPLLRLGRGGWHDPHAHRAFVRLANRLALRKRQQRDRTGDAVRLYQLEIIKVRAQLSEMARIGRRSVSGASEEGIRS